MLRNDTTQNFKFFCSLLAQFPFSTTEKCSKLRGLILSWLASWMHSVEFHMICLLHGRDIRFFQYRKGNKGNFIYCWPCISSQILVNNQPDALFHIFVYSFHLSTCFGHQVLIIRRSNCINTSSGVISLCKWLLGMPARSSFLTGIPSVTYTD